MAVPFAARTIKQRLANVVSYCTHRITNAVAFLPMLQVFSVAMTAPTYASLIELMTGRVFAPRRTIMGMLRAGGVERHHSGVSSDLRHRSLVNRRCWTGSLRPDSETAAARDGFSCLEMTRWLVGAA